MATTSIALSAEVHPSHVMGRWLWECDCGHQNDHRVDSMNWRAECARCGAAMALARVRLTPRSGRSRLHFWLWSQRQLSRR